MDVGLFLDPEKPRGLGDQIPQRGAGAEPLRKIGAEASRNDWWSYA